MRRILVLALAAIAIAAASATAAPSSAPRGAVIAYWKSTALKPGRLTAWWRGYLSSPLTRLTGCRYETSRGARFYSCQITILSESLGSAALVKTGPCAYSELLYESSGAHQMSRSFRFCG